MSGNWNKSAQLRNRTKPGTGLFQFTLHNKYFDCNQYSFWLCYVSHSPFLKVAESTDFHVPDNSEAETQCSEM